MRVTRSLMVLVAAAIAVAGCARPPVGAPVAAAPPPPGIDNVVYGSVPPPAAAPVAARRGLFTATPAANILAAPAAPVIATPVAAPMAAPVMATPMVAGPIAPPMAAMPVAYTPGGEEGPYFLDSGDRLRIVVFGQEGLSNSYAVDASGHIAMPLIGPVLARGATTNQLSNRIAEKLRDGFIREPHVAVEIEAYRPFFILGEVTAPGQYPFVANMSVETAVAIAGGFTPRAFRKTVMLNRTLNGRQVRISVPVTFALRPGDTINVQERWF